MFNVFFLNQHKYPNKKKNEDVLIVQFVQFAFLKEKKN